MQEEGAIDNPERYTQDGIAERREHVWRFMVRRVPQTVMAKLLNVSRKTIVDDVRYLEEQRGDYMNRVKNNPDIANMDIGMTTMRLEGISQSAMGDYELAKTTQIKNLCLNTAIKAEDTRTKILVNSGILPKAGEDMRITHNHKGSFTDKLGEDSPLAVLDDPSSARKILSAAEKILKLSAGRTNIKHIDTTIIDIKPSNSNGV